MPLVQLRIFTCNLAQAPEGCALVSFYQVNKKDLVKVTAQKMSAEDPRQSAANVGYVGVGMFMLAVAFIVFLDITAITRDLKVLLGNLGDSLFRFIRWITCGMFKSEINQA